MTPELATPFLPHHNKMWTLNLEPIYTAGLQWQQDSNSLPSDHEFDHVFVLIFFELKKTRGAPSGFFLPGPFKEKAAALLQSGIPQNPFLVISKQNKYSCKMSSL
ncbi:hypothetical protein TNCV_1294491 [Trichonephila clavipes]|nr:hypothetical protein TNCV_1294491 [Trichonephila clavipes]